jgi:hypothetical protein
MHARTLIAAALTVASATLAACSGDNVLGIGIAGGGTNTDSLSNARIRFANATSASLDVATGGAVTTGNGSLGFGAASSCISTNAVTPNVAVRIAGTTSVVPGFTTAYQSGVSYTVIAHTGANGATQFATLPDTYTPASGQTGLRVFNAGSASSSYDVYVTTPNAPLGSTPPIFGGVTAGSSSGFIDVSTTGAQQVRVTAAGSKAVLLDLGTVTFVAGQSVTLVLAPPLAGGGTSPRSFLVATC